eukprot:1879681-Pyramimonas_sp.AAC.1
MTSRCSRTSSGGRSSSGTLRALGHPNHWWASVPGQVLHMKQSGEGRRSVECNRTGVHTAAAHSARNAPSLLASVNLPAGLLTPTRKVHDDAARLKPTYTIIEEATHTPGAGTYKVNPVPLVGFSNEWATPWTNRPATG